MNRDPRLPFVNGELAQLINLKRNEFNNKYIHILCFDEISQRYAVQLEESGKRIKVQVKNLIRVVTNPLNHQEYDRCSKISMQSTDIKELRELKEKLLSMRGITETQRAILADSWAGAMFQFASDVGFREIIPVLETIIDSLEDPFERLILTPNLAAAEANLGNDERCIDLLEAWLDRHSGYLPGIATTLFHPYYKKGRMDKVVRLYTKADEIIRKGLYSSQCNIQQFYQKAADCFLPHGIDYGGRLIKPEMVHLPM
eukprot:UN03115